MHPLVQARPPARARRSMALSLALAAAVLSPSACHRGASSVTAGARETWAQQLLAERAATDREMKSSPTSPMAGASRYVLPAPGSGWVVVSPSGVSLAHEASAESPLSFAFRGGWLWDGGPKRAWRENDPATLTPGPISDGALFRVGRFTLATYASAEQLVVISPAYNCPFPPAENRLPVAIRAGEKTYPH